MFRGMSTITYLADDVAAARDWYRDLLGTEPYFAKEFGGALAYVEFRLGDRQDELGILDARYAATRGVGGAVTYWAVDDVQQAHARLLAHGATEHLPLTEQGDGFVTASVIDPFGNAVGVMFNQHYLEMNTARGRC